MSAPKMFHLAWFTNFMQDEWTQTFAQGDSTPWDGEFYIYFAKALERACFDYMMFEDTVMMPEAYGGSAKAYLEGALQVPKGDPAMLAAVLGAHTRHLGVVATMSTLSHPPFLLARMASTIDHIAHGRFGWNIVTSEEDTAAQNFGLDKLPERELRYEQADEYMDVVNGLFDSWEPGSIVMDRENGLYADHTRIRPINHVGKYYKVRGPLNTAPSPQQRPTYVQAGGSERGRDFAARHADSIVAVGNGIEGMKAFRDDVRSRAEKKFGRDPDDIKVFFLFTPVLGETEREARLKYERGIADPAFITRRLAGISMITDIDLSRYRLDEPLPEDLTTNGGSASFKRFAQLGSGKTLREVSIENAADAVGTPEQVADRMEEIMEGVGGDGFLIRHPFGHISRRAILEVTEGLVPVLQKRGLVRTRYSRPTLRETLREF